MLMKTLFLCVLAVICGLWTVPARAELLVNPGFELGAPPPPAVWQEGWVPANWFKWGVGGWASWKSASRQSIPYSPRSGDKFYAVGAWTTGDHQNIGQVVGVYPGEIFTFSVWARTELWTPTASAPYGYLLVQWYDAGGVQIGSDEFSNLMSGVEVSTYTQYSYTTTAAPAGAVTADFQIQGDALGTVMVDDASVKLRYAANDPIPDINASIPPSTTQLQWTRPAPRTTGPVTVDVWFGTSIVGMTKVVSNQAVDSWTISPPLSGSNPIYYWRVDCIDGTVTTGRQWQFYTNQAPVVDAGPKQNIWLASGTASADMNATATDDNLPNPPAAMTYLWTKDSGPGTVTFTPSATVLKPTAAFTTAGDYVLKLAANDSSATSNDTVMIRVFASGDTGLIAEYRLNETSGTTAADSVGGHTGTLNGTVAPTWLPTGGKIGGALQLTNSSNQYVDCGGGYVGDHNTDPTWADLRNEITVSAWIKLPTAGWPGGNLPWTAVVTKGDSSWRLTRNANTNVLYFYCNGLAAFGQEVIGTTDVADNKWHFVAGTYDGATIALYVDGILQHSYPSSGLIAFNDYNISIGYNEEMNGRFFSGVIDQVRIHNVGLSQAKIREQYTADGGSKICPGYLVGDLNQDCYVDLYDFAQLAENWMLCNDITNPGRCQ
jgi:hypothetical protein